MELQIWIAITDKLPKNNEEVIIANKYGIVGVRRYHNKGTWFGDEENFETHYITHWMPLPQNPNKDKSKDYMNLNKYRTLQPVSTK